MHQSPLRKSTIHKKTRIISAESAASFNFNPSILIETFYIRDTIYIQHFNTV